MDRRVDGERQAGLLHPLRNLDLLGHSTLIGGDAIGILGVHVLNRELHMIEAELGELHHAVARERDARRDEVRVEPDFSGHLDDVLEILARRRLAPRKVDLQHAEAGCLTHHVLPFGRREFGVGALEFERIRTVRTLQRALVREFAQHADGRTRTVGRLLHLTCCRLHIVCAAATSRHRRFGDVWGMGLVHGRFSLSAA